MSVLENVTVKSIKWTSDEQQDRADVRALLFDKLSIEGFKELGIKPNDPKDGILYFTFYFEQKEGYLTWNIDKETEESTVWLALVNQDEEEACILPEGVECKCKDGYKEEEYRELPHITTFQEFKELYNLLNG